MLLIAKMQDHACNNTSQHLLASSPDHSQLSVLHVEKREGLVREVTCVTFRWKGGGRVIIMRGHFLNWPTHKLQSAT